MSEINDDNVVFMDEFKRERWLARLDAARQSGEVAVFGALNPDGAIADVLPFPSPDGDDAA